MYNINYVSLTKPKIFTKKENNSIEIIELNREAIISNYISLVEKYQKEFDENEKFFIERERLFNEKKCYCGGNLIWKESHLFFGCENYSKQGQHLSVSVEKKVKDATLEIYVDKPIWFKKRPSIRTAWIPDLIKDIGLKGKIQAKILSEWFNKNGFEDLIVKAIRLGWVRDDFSKLDFDGYKKTNERSKEQEKIVLEILNGKYNPEESKILYQQTVTYQLNGSLEKFCIPDFIVGLKDEVIIYDCKLGIGDYDFEKATLYKELIEFFLKERGDLRPVKFSYIYYQEESISDFSYLNILKEGFGVECIKLGINYNELIEVGIELMKIVRREENLRRDEKLKKIEKELSSVGIGCVSKEELIK